MLPGARPEFMFHAPQSLLASPGRTSNSAVTGGARSRASYLHCAQTFNVPLQLFPRKLFNADAREPSIAPGLGLPGDIPLARRSLYVQAAHHL